MLQAGEIRFEARGLYRAGAAQGRAGGAVGIFPQGISNGGFKRCRYINHMIPINLESWTCHLIRVDLKNNTAACTRWGCLSTPSTSLESASSTALVLASQAMGHDWTGWLKKHLPDQLFVTFYHHVLRELDQEVPIGGGVMWCRDVEGAMVQRRLPQRLGCAGQWIRLGISD